MIAVNQAASHKETEARRSIGNGPNYENIDI